MVHVPFRSLAAHFLARHAVGVGDEDGGTRCLRGDEAPRENAESLAGLELDGCVSALHLDLCDGLGNDFAGRSVNALDCLEFLDLDVFYAGSRGRGEQASFSGECAICGGGGHVCRSGIDVAVGTGCKSKCCANSCCKSNCRCNFRFHKNLLFKDYARNIEKKGVLKIEFLKVT